MRTIWHKMVCTLLVLICLTGTTVQALGDMVDFSSYSDDELVQLLDALQQEIVDRGIVRSAELAEGEYLVGVDIPAGTYDIFVDYTKDSWWMDIYIYSDEAKSKILKNFTVFPVGDDGDGTGHFHVRLSEGQLLRCTWPITLTIYHGAQFN